MPELIECEQYYDAEYVRGRENLKWRFPSILRAAFIIQERFRPKSVVDFGAANGFYLVPFYEAGCRVCGVEGTAHWLDPMARRIGRENCAIVDLRKLIDLGRKFELALCIEVLEHLEEGCAEMAVKNIVRHGKTLFVTASSRKGGFRHLNPQSKSYWVNLFGRNGAVFQKVLTDELQASFAVRSEVERLRWLREDLMIFEIEK